MNNISDNQNKIMFCPYCGTKLDEGASFCKSCGKQVDNNISTKTSPEENPTVRKSVYEGNIHKCPNCGSVVESFKTNCSYCGYEFRGTRNTSCVDELAKKLEKTEDTEQKDELIRNFYIPNTKEDICEFIILATSNINSGGYVIEAWYTKLEQAYQKARLSFSDEPEFQYLSQLYYKAKKRKTIKFFGRSIKKSKMFQCLLLFIFDATIILIGIFCGSESGDSDSPYYMVSMIGFIFLLATGLYALPNGNDGNNKDDEHEEL